MCFPPEWPIPIDTEKRLTASAASGAGGLFMTTSQLCLPAGLTGSVPDAHFAISLGQRDDEERIS